MKEKGMSKGEFNSVAQANGGLDNMVNWDGKEADQQVIAKLCSNDRKSSLLLFLFSGTRGHQTEITTEFDGINDWCLK